jgi:hypothetical protein
MKDSREFRFPFITLIMVNVSAPQSSSERDSISYFDLSGDKLARQLIQPERIRKNSCHG